MGEPTDAVALAAMIDAYLAPARCPGRGSSAGHQHCAECCFGTGFAAEDLDDLETLQSLDAALFRLRHQRPNQPTNQEEL